MFSSPHAHRERALVIETPRHPRCAVASGGVRKKLGKVEVFVAHTFGARTPWVDQLSGERRHAVEFERFLHFVVGNETVGLAV